MVAKIITGKSVKGILNYNEHKVRESQAELLLAHRFLGEPHELAFEDKLRRFERLLEKRPRVRTNAVHISLNFDVGEQLGTRKLQAIAQRYMDKIGFGEQPYLVYRHLDAAHPHLHLVTTSIRPDGTCISLHNIGSMKSEPARKEVEQEFGLVQAESKQQGVTLPNLPAYPEKAHYGKSETKRTISRVVSAVTSRYNYTSLAELNAVLRSFQVTADRGGENTRMYQKKGLLYSIINERGEKMGVPIKASALQGKPTLAKLEKLFLQNKKVRKLYREGLKSTMEKVLSIAPPPNRKGFIFQLQQEQIQVLFRENAQGITYGITFIDHRRKAVFNGSELGKAYSAKALTEQFTKSEQIIKPGGQDLAKEIHPETQSTTALQQILYPVASGIATADLLDGLMRAEQQQDYLPHPLQQKKRKRKKKRPNL